MIPDDLLFQLDNYKRNCLHSSFGKIKIITDSNKLALKKLVLLQSAGISGRFNEQTKMYTFKVKLQDIRKHRLAAMKSNLHF